MPGLLPNVDPDGLLEYSVVYTDRALNHMSQSFQAVMRDSSALLKEVYNADGVAIVPGSGTFGMEAVARQFGTGKKCLVIRNGWFSFRWTQIFEMGKIPSDSIVLKARQAKAEAQAPFAPCPIEEVVETIKTAKLNVRVADETERKAMRDAMAPKARATYEERAGAEGKKVLAVYDEERKKLGF